jgi:hypothetical protein
LTKTHRVVLQASLDDDIIQELRFRRFLESCSAAKKLQCMYDIIEEEASETGDHISTVHKAL